MKHWKFGWAPNAAKLVSGFSMGPDPLSVVLTSDELVCAEHYFFWKGTLEVKQFCAVSDYEDATEKNLVLYYNGQIISDQQITVVRDCFWDILPLNFC